MATIEANRTRRGESRVRVRSQQQTSSGIVGQSMSFSVRTDAERFSRMLDLFAGDGEKASAAVGGVNTAVKSVRLQKSSGVVTLRVNKACKRDGGDHHYVSSTKTVRSRRTVSVGETLGHDLLELAEGRLQSDLLFVNAAGGQIVQEV